MVRLSFQKIAEINDTSVERDVKLHREVKGLRTDMNQRFQSLEDRLDGLRQDTNTRFQALESKFDSLENRFDSLEHRFESLENKVDTHLSEQTELLKILVKNTSKD